MKNRNIEIRDLLKKIRLIESNTIDITDSSPETESSNKITFDKINTVGFVTLNNRHPNVLDQVKMAVEAFIITSGLLLSTVNIVINDGRIILNSETVKNPELDVVKRFILDTDKEHVVFENIAGSINVGDGLIEIFRNVNEAYNDNQIGRNHFIALSQGEMGYG